MKKYFIFLLCAYGTAYGFEYLANTIGDGTLFERDNALPFFILWYGVLYTILYIFLKHNNPLVPALVLACIGPVLEFFVFHRLNIIIDPIIYACMGFIPFFVFKRIIPHQFK